MKDGLDTLIAQLHHLRGAAFWQQLAAITRRAEFHLVENGIYAVGVFSNPDFGCLLDAARKAVALGYSVYILPNPRRIKSADFIFKKKGVYKLFELKTITGQSSAGNRIQDAAEQSNHILLNVIVKYNPRKLGKEIRTHFETNKDSKEILVFTGKRAISISRQTALSKGFGARFSRMFN